MSKVDFTRAQPVFDRAGNVIAAWAFGSAKEGILRAGGDVDIAVLFDQSPSLDERVELLIGLQRALGIDEVDLVVLNGASPVTRFEAVSGRLLFSRHIGKQAEFVSLAAREYEYAMALYQWGLANRPQTTESRP